MRTFCFYRLDTGHFLPGCLSADALPAPPSGLGVMEGSHDHMSERVDLETGSAVEWIPVAPEDDDLRTWAWDVEAKRYVATPTLLAVKAAAREAIDRAAGAARRRYITDVPGQVGVYLQKLEQARAYSAAGFVGTVPPYIEAEAVANGNTDYAAAAQTILGQAEAWEVLSCAIEAARLAGKRQVSESTDKPSAEAARDASIASLNAI